MTMAVDAHQNEVTQAIELLERLGYSVIAPVGAGEASTRPPVAPPPKAKPDLVVTLPGHPRGKGRHRTRVIVPKDRSKAPFATQYPDPETVSYEAMLKYAAEQAMRGRPLYAGALRVRVNALMAVPASWSGKKQREALDGIIRPTGKPDWDNFAKVCDAFNSVVWVDDAQIVDGRVVKAYSQKAGFEIEVYQLRLRQSLL